MLTRNTFDVMQEDALREDVLMHLLTAMGFNDVDLYHGGSGEKGKDLICWKPDDLNVRVNYAVVAKSVKLTGKVQPGKGAASEIASQIRQCFGYAFTDKKTSALQRVHVVWVASNKPINKVSREAITAIVADEDKMSHVRFIDGDALWSLIEKFYPLSAWHYINEARKRFQVADSHYEPIITIDGSQTFVSLREKFPGAALQKPIKIEAKFELSEEEAENLHSHFQRHEETGEAFSIPTEYIVEVDVPDFMKTIFGSQEFRLTSLEVLPNATLNTVPLQLSFHKDSHELLSINHLDFKVVQAGTKEIKIVTQDNEPLHLALSFQPEAKIGNIFLQRRDTPINALQYLTFMKIISCLNDPVIIGVTHSDSGIRLCEMHSEKIDVVPPDPRYIELIEKLATIQKAVKSLIIMPERDFTNGEVAKIDEIYEIVTSGRINRNRGTLSLCFEPKPEYIDQAIELFESIEGKNIVIGFRESGDVLFDTVISLGPVRHEVFGAKALNLDEVRGRANVIKSDSTTIKLEVALDEGGTIKSDYENWLHISGK